MLSNKYEELKIIYESTASLVILVRHKDLGEERIIKRVAKESLSKEVKILLNLRHPGIPLLYDYDEDDKYFYIVEEYIKGMSLAEYIILHQISDEFLMKIAVSLFEIIYYLHQQPIPICYLDMKPENIIVADRIVLIDYGISRFIDNSDEIITEGTRSYASKNQCEGKCSLENDIISTQKTIRRIYDTSCNKNIKIERLLNDNNKESLYHLEKWKKLYSKTNKEMKHLDVKIGVIGNDKGIGVTHIAISACCYLNQKGIRSIYYDNSNNNVLEKIIIADSSFKIKDNYIYHWSFNGIINKSPAIEEKKNPFGVCVIDCGTNDLVASECDYIIYVQSSRNFKNNIIKKLAYNNKTVVLINPESFGVGVFLAKELDKKVFAYPLDKNPFFITKKKRKLFDKILMKELMGEKVQER